MSKHTNKHWLREKEYTSLQREENFLYSTLSIYRWRVVSNKRLSEIDYKLNHTFFNEYRGKYRNAPKWYRKMLNRTKRSK